ncbi:MAG: type II secretion system protein [Vicinamibacterales bacterium]
MAGQRGYAMAALLVALSVMAVLLAVAMPVWKTATKREKEAELIWRASQYARAIALFQRKYANAYPPNLDILLNERFLRKKYKDPMTKDGEFQLVYANTSSDGSRPGAVGGARPPSGASQPSTGRPQMPAGTSQPSAGAAPGGIIGVVSKSTESSLRIFNGRSKYNEWTFTPQTVLGARAPGAGSATPGGVPGATRPGGIGPGNVGPGGRPIGPGAPRGQINLDRFGRPTPQQPGQPQQPRPFGLPPQRPPGGGF